MSTIFPLAVVIPNWNLRDDTIACVRSVLVAAGDFEVAIIVVDNGSTDGSSKALTDAFGPRVDQILMGANSGFVSAVNAGIRHALASGAAAVLVLNNDTFIDPSMLAVLGGAAEAHPEAGILCPAIFYMKPPDRIWRLGDRDHRWLPIPLRVPDDEARKPLVELDYATGCGMLVRREVFEAIGDLDRTFFMYYEDADFCRRARAGGFRILCIPAARMWHKVSATAARDGPVQVFWRARGQVLFYRKHAGRGFKRLAHIYLVGKTAVSCVRCLAQGQHNHAAAHLRGARAGCRAQIDRGIDHGCK